MSVSEGCGCVTLLLQPHGSITREAGTETETVLRESKTASTTESQHKQEKKERAHTQTHTTTTKEREHKSKTRHSRKRSKASRGGGKANHDDENRAKNSQRVHLPKIVPLERLLWQRTEHVEAGKKQQKEETNQNA